MGSQVPAEAREHKHLMCHIIPVKRELGWKHGGEQCLQGAEQWLGGHRDVEGMQESEP